MMENRVNERPVFASSCILSRMRSAMQCYLMPDETALRELSEGVIEKLKLLTDAEFAELEFPPD